MKLYATTTSERASKGQGGNHKLVINLQIDSKKRMEIGNLVLTCTTYPKGNDVYDLVYYPINSNCQDQDINSGKVVLLNNFFISAVFK
jgi:hypothetical protein